jgi:hypothetical protein
MPARLINPVPPRIAEAPAAPCAAPPRPASEDTGQRSSAIIPGDDPGDQQPPKSTQKRFQAPPDPAADVEAIADQGDIC